jgi:hypothetical protein
MTIRPFGTHLPVDAGPLPPDIVQTLLLAAGTAQSLDWFSTAGTAAANAGTAGVQVVALTGQTTANASLNFSVNLYSTGVISPTSGTSVNTTGSSGVSHPVNGSAFFQVPGNSTGWSAIALTSGYVMCEQWHK